MVGQHLKGEDVWIQRMFPECNIVKNNLIKKVKSEFHFFIAFLLKKLNQVFAETPKGMWQKYFEQ